MSLSKWRLLQQFAARHYQALLLIGAVGLIANLMTLLIPLSIGKYYDLLFGYGGYRAQVLDALPGSWMDTVPHFLIFFVLVVLLRSATSFWQRYATGILGERLVKDLRERLFAHQLQTRIDVFEERGTGKYLLRYSGDLKSIQNYLMKGLIRFGIDLILLILAVVVLFSLNAMATGIILVGSLVVMGAVYLLNRWLYTVSVDRRNLRSSLLAFVSQSLASVAAIQVLNKAPTEQGKYEKRSDRLFDKGRQFQAVYNLVFVTVPGLLYLSLAAVMFFLYRAHEQGGGLNEGGLLGFILLFITVLPVFRRVLRVSTVWKVGDISFEKLLKVLDLPVETTPEREREFTYNEGLIELRDLSFQYERGRPVLQNLHARFLPGQITHVKAGPGQGKSTLIDLLTGLRAPVNGEVIIDGQNCAIHTQKSLRKHMAVVSEVVPLLGKTVFEAISYSRKPEKRLRVQKLLDQLQQGLPTGQRLNLDDPIGEGGNNLSGREQKLLSYARALLTNKRMLLVEHPFRSLEPEVQKVVVRKLKRLREKGGTVVLLGGEEDSPGLANATVELQTGQRTLAPVGKVG